MSANPEVMQFVLEKLAVPVWLRRMKGFIKGKPWTAWTGEARAAGRVRAQQHGARKAFAEKARVKDFNVGGVDRSLKSQERVLGRQGGTALEDVRKNLAKIPDPRHRQLLTQRGEQGAGWIDPLIKSRPETRLKKVQQYREGPLQMDKKRAVRNVAGIPHKPLPLPTPATTQEAYIRYAPPHMTPAPGQTAAFNTMMRGAPQGLQPRFEAVQQQILARQAAQAERAAAMGQGTVAPPRRQAGYR